MAIAVKNNTLVAVMIESVEGIYEPPAAATDFIQTLSDGLEMTPTREVLERQIFNGSIGMSTARTGIRSVTGSIPVEFRASETEGAAPEYDELLLGALGQKRSTATFNTDTGHSTTVINILDANIGDIQIGDMVMIKEVGDFHVSPVIAVDDTPSSANFTILVPADSAPADNVAISAFTTYVTADSGHPALSISKYVEDAVLEQGVGSKVTSMSLDNFQTGQIASLNFGIEGLDFDRSFTAPPFVPDYQDALPPIILSACLFQDDIQLDINNLTVSLENALGFVTATCSVNGRISSRVTERTVTGSINPYKESDDLTQFIHFNCNSSFSLFVFAQIPALDANCDPTGEFSQVIGIYMPNCIITELGEGDQDGLLLDEASYQASRGADGTEEEIYITYM